MSSSVKRIDWADSDSSSDEGDNAYHISKLKQNHDAAIALSQEVNSSDSEDGDCRGNYHNSSGGGRSYSFSSSRSDGGGGAGRRDRESFHRHRNDPPSQQYNTNKNSMSKQPPSQNLIGSNNRFKSNYNNYGAGGGGMMNKKGLNPNANNRRQQMDSTMNWKDEARHSTMKKYEKTQPKEQLDGSDWMKQRRAKQQEREHIEQQRRLEERKKKEENRKNKLKSQADAFKAAILVNKQERLKELEKQQTEKKGNGQVELNSGMERDNEKKAMNDDANGDFRNKRQSQLSSHIMDESHSNPQHQPQRINTKHTTTPIQPSKSGLTMAKKSGTGSRPRLQLAPRTKPIPDLEVDPHYANIKEDGSGNDENDKSSDDNHQQQQQATDMQRGENEPKHPQTHKSTINRTPTPSDTNGMKVEKILTRPKSEEENDHHGNKEQNTLSSESKETVVTDVGGAVSTATYKRKDDSNRKSERDKTIANRKEQKQSSSLSSNRNQKENNCNDDTLPDHHSTSPSVHSHVSEKSSTIGALTTTPNEIDKKEQYSNEGESVHHRHNNNINRRYHQKNDRGSLAKRQGGRGRGRGRDRGRGGGGRRTAHNHSHSATAATTGETSQNLRVDQSERGEGGGHNPRQQHRRSQNKQGKQVKDDNHDRADNSSSHTMNQPERVNEKDGAISSHLTIQKTDNDNERKPGAQPHNHNAKGKYNRHQKGTTHGELLPDGAVRLSRKNTDTTFRSTVSATASADKEQRAGRGDGVDHGRGRGRGRGRSGRGRGKGRHGHERGRS